MDLNPKERFQKSEHAKTFLDIATNPAFHAAMEAALGEMQWRSQRATGDADPAMCWHKFMGAREYMATLLNLVEMPDTGRKPAPRQNLQPL